MSDGTTPSSESTEPASGIGQRLRGLFRRSSGKKKRPLYLRFLGWWRHGRWIGLVFLLAIGVLRAVDPSFVQSIRNQSFDIYQRIQPRVNTQDLVTIVDIDGESLQTVGQWPWGRDTLATLLENLMKQGAIVVGFDMIFPERDRLSPDLIAASMREKGLDDQAADQIADLPSNDVLFGNILSRSRAVVGQGAKLAVVVGAREGLPPESPKGFIGGKPHQFLWPPFVTVLRNIEEIEEGAPGRGMVTVSPDNDGVVRRAPAVIKVGENIYPSLVVEMMRVASGPKAPFLVRSNKLGIRDVVVAKFPIETDEKGNIWVYFTKPGQGRYISAASVLDGTAPQERIAGKWILIGTAASGLENIRATPIFGALPGVEVHANMLEMILTNTQLNRPIDAIGQEISFALIVGIIMIILLPIIGAAMSLGLAVVLVGGLVGFSWYLFSESLTFIDVTYPAISTFGLYSILTYTSYSQTSQEKKQVRGAFGRYLSSALVEQLADDPDRLVLGGEMRDMTLLFCDIRGFTTISEVFKTNPQGLTNLINKFLTPMTNLILDRRGTIDKYMGDCIMAFWNAPIDDDEHALHAADAALCIFEELPKLNERLEAEAKADDRVHHPINVGVGLNSGDCVVGNMGSEQRFDYSVLGDAVNLAARLEGQSKNYGANIVIGEQTYLKIPSYASIEMDLIAVKGKTEAVRIYGLLGRADTKDGEVFKKLHASNTALLEAYRGQDWIKSEGLVAECRANAEPFPDKLDVLYDLYAERIEDYKIEPPPEDWDGVFVATSK